MDGSPLTVGVISMLSDKDIKDLIDKKKLLIEPFSKKSIGCASIDLSLGNIFTRYSGTIDTRSENIAHESYRASELSLYPGEFILAVTKERVKIPNGHYGFIETRGNFSRAGISVSCDDGHIDPGTDGVITLEIRNNNNVPVKLYSGDFICQLFLFRLSSDCIKIYSGKYKNQNFPTIFKK
jgi:dCTP deaminase